MPVSYTHRDVYKRQISQRSDEDKARYGYIQYLCNPLAVFPVSYTHLDVYKRQSYSAVEISPW